MLTTSVNFRFVHFTPRKVREGAEVMPSPVLTRHAHQPHRQASCIHVQNKIISLSGASGSGKNFWAKQLKRWYNKLELIRSFVTRDLRPGQDEEYQKISPEEFHTLIENGEFRWHTQKHGNHYGTLRCDIDEAVAAHEPSLIHMTPDTIPYLRDYVPGQVFSIYLFVADEDLLLQRIQNRDPGKSPSYYEDRISECRDWERDARASGRFNAFINNDDRERGFEELLDEITSHLRNPPGLPVAF